MLMQIRDKATGIFAYIIVILIAIPFAFWGIQEYFTGPADQNVAEVNGEEIIKRVFDSQLQDQRRYLKSLYGDQAEEIFGENDSKLKQQVLDGMVQNILIGEELQSTGYRTSDSRLFERIRSIPQFQIDGKFDATTYENLLAAQQRNPVEFEAQLRQEDNINQYQGSVAFSGFLPSKDKEQYAQLNKQKRDFNYFVIKADWQSIEATDQQISDYYEANKNSFQTPAQVKLEYIEVDQNNIGNSLEFSEDELLEIYEQDVTQYQSQELRKAKHILFKLPEDATDKQVAAAFLKGQTAVDRLSAGEDFSVVATDVSEDTFSAKNGGDLGFLARNDIDNPEFMSKLFSMNVGDTSHAMRTKLGIQIIQLEDITEPKQKSFEEARTHIENTLRGEIASKEFSQQAQELQELSYENEDSLQVPAEALDVEVQSTDWISSQSAEGIGSYPKVISAAFSEDVLDNRYNSELLELHDGHVAVIRVAEYKEPEIKPLEEVSEAIRKIISFQEAYEQAVKSGEDAVTKLQANPNLVEEVVSELNATLEAPGALLRDDTSVAEEVIEFAFAMQEPEDGQTSIDGLQLNDGSYAVIVLNDIQDPTDDTEIELSEWGSVQGAYSRREVQAMLKALRETADVKVYPENL